MSADPTEYDTRALGLKRSETKSSRSSSDSSSSSSSSSKSSKSKGKGSSSSFKSSKSSSKSSSSSDSTSASSSEFHDPRPTLEPTPAPATLEPTPQPTLDPRECFTKSVQTISLACTSFENKCFFEELKIGGNLNFSSSSTILQGHKHINTHIYNTPQQS